MKTFLLSLTLGSLALWSCSEGKKKSKSELPPEELVRKEAFKNHSDSIPTDRKTFFELNAEYPRKLPNVGFKFINDFKQPITVQNAETYVSKMKEYASPLIMKMINEKEKFNAKEVGWFHEPWMGSKRDPIMGTYPGNPNSAGTFKGVNKNQEGFVLVLYDPLAAFTIGEIFDKNGNVPLKIDSAYFKSTNSIHNSISIDLNKDKGQFKEGSVIVKFAFSELNGNEWDDMKDAPLFTIYNQLDADPKDKNRNKYDYKKVSLFQIDIVVKDSKAAPETGWIFSTLVYDKNIKSNNILDKFVPLGAMWGMDPDVDSDFTSLEVQNQKLKQTWVNNNAPYYSRETLGWGGRLSGPNDGAVVLKGKVAFTNKGTNKTDTVEYARLPVTSCMSCHLPAQQKFSSFLLPSPNYGKKSYFNYNTPDFLRYNRNLKGKSFDPGQFSFDYNMTLSFKSMKAYLNFLDQYYKPKKTGSLRSSKEPETVEDSFEEFRRKKIGQ